MKPHPGAVPRLRSRKSLARAGVQTSFMSDAKWRKLFTVLRQSSVKVDQIVVKFVDSDLVHRVPINGISVRSPHAYMDGHFGPTPLRDIEWIEIPTMAEHSSRSPDGKGRVSPTLRKQDIDGAEALLVATARFPMERKAHGLRISGYSRG
jgi:hypothetical protein